MKDLTGYLSLLVYSLVYNNNMVLLLCIYNNNKYRKMNCMYIKSKKQSKRFYWNHGYIYIILFYTYMSDDYWYHDVLTDGLIWSVGLASICVAWGVDGSVGVLPVLRASLFSSYGLGGVVTCSPPCRNSALNHPLTWKALVLLW